jgi:uncharacterized protein (TIGR03435 family)
LVTQAYDRKRFEVIADRWMDDTRYDVTAKVPAGATKDQFRLMLQRFLVDRFRLATHHESKEMSVYELVIGKDGPRFKESAKESVESPTVATPEPPPPGPLPKDKDGHPVVPPGATIFETTNGVPWAHMNAKKETMDSFVARVSSFLRQPVFDATGLKGRYDFDLTWSPDLAGMGVPPPPPMAGVEAPSAPLAPDGPTLFGAIQSQLGLKLESRKRQVDVLVLDHAEKVPTEN